MSGLRSRGFLIALAAVSSLTWASLASANTSGGLRAGFSSGPDQFVVGGQLELSPVADNVYIIPSGEVGFGDHLTSLAFNGDVQYRFVVHRSKVRPYAGGGLSVYYVNLDNGGGSDTHLGANILGGIYFNEHKRNPMFVDVKAGLTDEVPDWKFVYGIDF
jgi:hypothetical protein